MKTLKKLFMILSALPAFIILSDTTPKAEVGSGGPDEGPILVGRISHIEGQLLRHQPGDEDWATTLNDTPFGAEESLYTEGHSRAEVILPNGTWTRLDGATQIHLLELRDDLTVLVMDSGTARFSNRSDDSLMRVRTVFGDVTAPAGTEFDLQVYSNAVEVMSLKGTVTLWQEKTGQRFEVTAGSSPIAAGMEVISVGKGYEPPGWAQWNRERDALWAARMTSGEVSAAYLPAELRHDAYVLDENGVWERTYYDNGYYYFWRPTRVAAGWSPFTVGRWHTWYHESTWVPYEPFGYVTHHYGNWVFIGHSWYWSPPVARVHAYVHRPLLNIGFAWYPGRVAWLQFGTNIGWVPLTPHEPYYAHRRWGHKAVVVKDVHVTNLNVNVTHYKNYRHAVVIDRKDLHRVRNYRELKANGIDRTFVDRNYRVVPMLDRVVARPSADIRGARNTEKANSGPKSHFRPFEKETRDRLERSPDVTRQATKPVGKSPGERFSTARQRPQAQPRSGIDRVREATQPIEIGGSPSRQEKATAMTPASRATSQPSFNNRGRQNTLKSDRLPVTKAGPRKEISEVFKNRSRPMAERGLSKPKDEGRTGSSSLNSSRKLESHDSRAKINPSFFGVKRKAEDTGKRQALRQEQRQQTRWTKPSQAFEGGKVPEVSSGKGRFQPSSRGPMGGKSRGIFRN